MKIKILVTIVCMLLIFTTIPVAGTLNQNNSIYSQLEEKDSYPTIESDEDWWCMFRHDSGNTGCSSCEAPDTDELCWQQAISDTVGIATPIVVNEKMYLSTGGFYNIDPPEQNNLQMKSSNEKPSPVNIIPEIKSVLQNQYYGSLYCFNAVSGAPLWDFYVGMSQDPAVYDGKIYLTMLDYYSYSSTVQCRDADTGSTILWERILSGWILSSIIVADDKVYIGSLDLYSYAGKLYCLNAQTGNTEWTHTLEFFEFIYMSSPAVADGMVYFNTLSFYGEDSKLYCLDAETGYTQWYQPIGYSELSSPVVSDGQVYAISSNYYSYYGDLYCFDATTGSPLWTYNFNPYQFCLSNPSVYGDSIYVALIDYYSYYGRILSIDTGTGDINWDVELPGIPYYSSPAIADDKLYITVVDFFSYNGKLLCLSTNNGDTIWDYMLNYFSMSSPAIASGRVFAPDYLGNIYAIGFPNDPPTAPEINGEVNGKQGKSYDYTFVSTDPEEEEVYYFVYWGDGNSSGWQGPYPSGEVVTISHTWEEKGTYNVSARAKDIHGSKSDWSSLEITMPKSKQSSVPNIQNFLILLKQLFSMIEKTSILYLLFYRYFYI